MSLGRFEKQAHQMQKITGRSLLTCISCLDVRDGDVECAIEFMNNEAMTRPSFPKWEKYLADKNNTKRPDEPVQRISPADGWPPAGSGRELDIRTRIDGFVRASSSTNRQHKDRP